MIQNQFIENLSKIMINDYVAVNELKNPIVDNLNNLTQEQIAYIIAQYSIFPKNIVRFLTNARDGAKKSKWNEVAVELTRNLGEECGTETNGTPHYELLVSGIKNGIKSDIKNTKLFIATKEFITRMNKLTKNKDVCYSLGSIYACECSAVPELRIVLKIVNRLFKEINGKEIEDGTVLKKFFDKHLNTWEPGHEEGLRINVLKYIGSNRDLKKFEKGFREVMITMDKWWNRLYKEAIEI